MRDASAANNLIRRNNVIEKLTLRSIHGFKSGFCDKFLSRTVQTLAGANLVPYRGALMKRATLENSTYIDWMIRLGGSQTPASRLSHMLV